MQDHYVYVYLDPRKEGDFKYDEFEFPFEPFYVGVSKNDGRQINHLAYAKKYLKDGIVPRSKRKVFKIASILKSGMTPVVTMFKDDLTEKEAYKMEVKMIDRIGRANFNTGPLLNVLVGGQIVDGKLISELLKGRTDINQYKNRIVQQFDLLGTFIQDWPSVEKARVELKVGHIDACCRGERKSAGGFIWKYKDGEIITRIKYRSRKTNKVKNKRSVEQYLDGIKINDFSSLMEASSITNIGRKNISNALSGYSNTAGGYVWKYKIQP